MELLKGKNAIITGSTRGIGRATVQVFAENGANIWACARKPDDEFEQDMAILAEKNCVRIWPIYFDVIDETQVKQAMRQIKKNEEHIDVLVNIAGITGKKTSFLMSSMDDMHSVFETNFFAVTLLTQYAVRLMARQNKKGGSIIFVSSIAGLDGTPSQYAYASSKSALLGAMKNLAREVADYNIRVNTVAPGIIKTDMGAEIEPNLRKEILSKVIMKREGYPEEIARVIAFLASDFSSYVNAQVIRVDGGI